MRGFSDDRATMAGYGDNIHPSMMDIIHIAIVIIGAE
jgi:hypothetical protein